MAKWKKGQSGNPGGRPKGHDAEVRDLARQYTTKAVNTLVRCLSAGDYRTRVLAANSLLDRGWGRPAQAVEVTGKDGKPIEVDGGGELLLLMKRLAGDDKASEVPHDMQREIDIRQR